MTSEEEKLHAIIHDLEQRLEIALLSANQVWWEWHIPTGQLRTHSVRECILGYNHSQINHDLDFWLAALPPEEREPVWQSLQEHLSGNSEMWLMEHRYKNADGKYSWVLEAGKVVSHNSDGSPLRMVGITQNIHEKKMQDEELQRKNARLTEALKLRDLVMAATSHDIKNALNSGWGFAQILKDEAIGKSKEFGVIEESLRKSVELISSIHEMSKGHLYEAAIHTVDISSIIQESYEFYAMTAHSKKLELKTNAHGKNLAETDPLILRRIIDNLVENAIKFTASGTISINDLSNKNTIILEVRDTGIGIPPEKTGQLFVRFQKLTDNKEGSGLGLSICQDLAKKLSSQVSFRPNTPSGSIFRLEIPRAVAPSE